VIGRSIRSTPGAGPGRPTRRARVRAVALLVSAAAALLPAPLPAQRILGGGSDGVTLPRGAFRVGLGGESMVQRDQWRDAKLEGLGGSITTDAFGALQFSMLASVEQRMQQLGVADFGASLGTTRLDARQRAFVMPLAIEYGLAEWLTLGVRATLVRTKAESQFRIRGDSGRATLGQNPYFLGSAVPGQNSTIVGAYAVATLNLLARRDQCQANPGAHPECATILAELAQVNALSARTGEFTQGLMYLYGSTLVPGQRWVPFAGSAADTTIRAHADSLRTALERYGVTDVTAATGLPAGAQLPLAAADLDVLVRDSTYGYGARALNDAGLTQIGDVHVSAMVRLYDSFAGRGPQARFAAGARGWRQSVLLEGRIGTSRRERADAFLDQGTGSGTSAVTVRSITDVVVSDRFWTTIALGYTQGFAKDFVMRLPSDAGAEWLEHWRERTVPVTPGAQFDVELSPRWHLNDYVALGAQWRWRRKAADRHDFTESVDLLEGGLTRTVQLEGALLDERTELDEQRVGVSATYSTLAARARGKPGMAFEISYLHQQSMASANGVVPKQFEDRLVVRYYTRFLGR
jgi:hypothetical protein